MPEPSRLTALPGYDTAPDVYETLDAADDTSSTIQTSPRSASEPSDTSEEEDEEESYGVSRRRLFPERARSRFGATSSRVETKHVDLSDRVDGRRRGYNVRRKGAGGVDAEEEEGLEARIARLRREIEECKAEAEEERQADDGAEDDQAVAGEEIDGLSRLLASIEVPTRPDARRARGQQRPATAKGAPIPPAEPDGEITDEQTLSRVADFDTRLAAMEQALGISTLDAATSEAVSAPLLPSLTLLDQQLSALTSATSLTNLEAAGSRIQKLKNAAEQLSHAQEASSDATLNGDSADGDTAAPSLSHDDMQKLHSLYALLPNLQGLAPTVPAMLARLRSLRTLHTSAANAASELEEVERGQAEMDKELAAWREGLEKVETAVGEASEANGRNGRFVDGWVKELEGRMKALR
ncbi:hypothetical protein LTR36_003291 [Oleoguttula mirabilis]|uniref:Dynactin subunit n=1 Tax=Oleoguttula mirabilis TaxID=1507867 RepID=A0AAV9JY98_9PEZI|nr:hypothetical protein LTR36_003291 [Oleoguttula mirabilis]